MTITDSREMKLYLWHDVLCDYTAGMAFAVAHSVEEARGLLVASEAYWGSSDLKSDPEVHELDQPFCAYVHGGG